MVAAQSTALGLSLVADAKVLESPTEDVSQQALVALREGSDGGGRFAHDLDHLLAQLEPFRGKSKRFDTPIAARASAFDQASGLEPVGNASDGRGIAEEPLSEHAHRQRSIGREAPQRECLGKLSPSSANRPPVRER